MKKEKDGKERVANIGEPLALPLEAGDYCVPRVNPRPFDVRQPVLQCGGDTIPRLGSTGKDERREYGKDWGGSETVEQLREKQFSHSLRAVSPDPPHHDHQEFCLVP